MGDFLWFACGKAPKFYIMREEKMIVYKQVDKTYFSQYDSIPMRVNVKSYYKIEKIDRGLGGFTFVEAPVDEPYIKDFCAGGDESAVRWERFGLSTWAFFMAFDGEKPVGAVAVASRSKTANMLAGRDDLAVLWDIRVHDDYKGQGIGQALFDMAVNWSREQGLSQLKIECQNNNIPAVKFYHKQGAVLSAIDEYAYYNEPEYRHETMLIWFLDL
jgi:ribosomal protein S18 acetylase RimI-like enzyme